MNLRLQSQYEDFEEGSLKTGK